MFNRQPLQSSEDYTDYLRIAKEAIYSQIWYVPSRLVSLNHLKNIYRLLIDRLEHGTEWYRLINMGKLEYRGLKVIGEYRV